MVNVCGVVIRANDVASTSNNQGLPRAARKGSSTPDSPIIRRANSPVAYFHICQTPSLSAPQYDTNYLQTNQCANRSTFCPEHNLAITLHQTYSNEPPHYESNHHHTLQDNIHAIKPFHTIFSSTKKRTIDLKQSNYHSDSKHTHHSQKHQFIHFHQYHNALGPK